MSFVMIELTIKNFSSFSYGKSLSATNRVYGNIPVYGSSGVTGYHNEALTSGPTVIIGRKGTVGSVYLSNTPCWPIDTTFFVEFEEIQDARFAYYVLKSVGLENMNSDSAVPGLNRDNAHAKKLYLPHRQHWPSIATVLGSLDDKIEQNRRTAQVLEKLARAIFRAWFVDFEPVKAKAAGATSFPSMPRPVFDALPTTFTDSDIGPVPEGWGTGTIEDVATRSKVQVKPQEYSEELFDHFSIPAFDTGMRAVVELGGAIKSNKFLVTDGCVLLSKLNPRTARIWLPPLVCNRRQITSTEFLVFVPSEPSGRHYLYCQFQQREFREDLAQMASGTSNSHQRVRPKDILSHPIVMATLSIRKAFANIADPLFALQLANQEESVQLAEIRDYLLPKLLSGDIRVGEAGKLASKAV